MKITIEFNNNIEHKYNSFDEITKLNNYNQIIKLYCFDKNLSNLSELPNSLIHLQYHNNPIHDYIQTYFDYDWKKYRKFQHETLRIFANKIGNWYLECKYNPEYKACKKRLKLEFDEMYDTS